MIPSETRTARIDHGDRKTGRRDCRFDAIINQKGAGGGICVYGCRRPESIDGPASVVSALRKTRAMDYIKIVVSAAAFRPRPLQYNAPYRAPAMPISSCTRRQRQTLRVYDDLTKRPSTRIVAASAPSAGRKRSRHVFHLHSRLFVTLSESGAERYVIVRKFETEKSRDEDASTRP